jgi:hypothetical protein
MLSFRLNKQSTRLEIRFASLLRVSGPSCLLLLRRFVVIFGSGGCIGKYVAIGRRTEGMITLTRRVELVIGSYIPDSLGLGSKAAATETHVAEDEMRAEGGGSRDSFRSFIA